MEECGKKNMSKKLIRYLQTIDSTNPNKNADKAEYFNPELMENIEKNTPVPYDMDYVKNNIGNAIDTDADLNRVLMGSSMGNVDQTSGDISNVDENLLKRMVGKDFITAQEDFQRMKKLNAFGPKSIFGTEETALKNPDMQMSPKQQQFQALLKKIKY